MDPSSTVPCKLCKYLEETLQRKQKLVVLLKNLLKTKDNHAFSGQQLLALRAKSLETTETLKREFVQVVTSVNHNIQQHARDRDKFEELKASSQDQNSVTAHQEFQIRQLYARIHSSEAQLKKVKDEFKAYQAHQLEHCTCGAQKKKKKPKGRPPLPSEPLPSASCNQPTHESVPEGILTPASSVASCRPPVSSPVIAWLDDVCSDSPVSTSRSGDDVPLSDLVDSPPQSTIAADDTNDLNSSDVSDSTSDDSPATPKGSVPSPGGLENSKMEMSSLPSLMDSPVKPKVQNEPTNSSIFDLPIDVLPIGGKRNVTEEKGSFNQRSVAPESEVPAVSDYAKSSARNDDVIMDQMDVADTRFGAVNGDQHSKQVPDKDGKPVLNVSCVSSEVLKCLNDILETVPDVPHVVVQTSPKRVVSLGSFLKDLSSLAKTKKTDMWKAALDGVAPRSESSVTPTLKSSSQQCVEQPNKAVCGNPDDEGSACEFPDETCLPMVSPIKTLPETPSKTTTVAIRASTPGLQVDTDVPRAHLRQRESPSPVVISECVAMPEDSSPDQSPESESLLLTESSFSTPSETSSDSSLRFNEASSPGTEREVAERKTSSPPTKSLFDVKETSEGELATCQEFEPEILSLTRSPSKTPSKKPTTRSPRSAEAFCPDQLADSERPDRKRRRRKTPIAVRASPLKRYSARSSIQNPSPSAKEPKGVKCPRKACRARRSTEDLPVIVTTPSVDSPQEMELSVGSDICEQSAITETLEDRTEDHCESQNAHSLPCTEPVRVGLPSPESFDADFRGFNDTALEDASKMRKRHSDWLNRSHLELKKSDIKIPTVANVLLSWPTTFTQPSTSKVSDLTLIRPVFNVEKFASFSDLKMSGKIDPRINGRVAARPDAEDGAITSLCWAFKLLSVEPTDQNSGNFFLGFTKKEIKIENDFGMSKGWIVKTEQDDAPWPVLGSTAKLKEATIFIDLSREDECKDRCCSNKNSCRRRENAFTSARNEIRSHWPEAPQRRYQPFKPEERPSCRFGGRSTPSVGVNPRWDMLDGCVPHNPKSADVESQELLGHEGPAWSAYRSQTQHGFHLNKPLSLAPPKLCLQKDPVLPRAECVNSLSRPQLTRHLAQAPEIPPKTVKAVIVIDDESLPNNYSITASNQPDGSREHQTLSPKNSSPDILVPGSPPKTASVVDEESPPRISSATTPVKVNGFRELNTTNKRSPGKAKISASSTHGRPQVALQSEGVMVPESQPKAVKTSIVISRKSPRTRPEEINRPRTPSPKKCSVEDVSASSTCGLPVTLHSTPAVVPRNPPDTETASIPNNEEMNEESLPRKSSRTTPNRSYVSRDKFTSGKADVSSSSTHEHAQVTLQSGVMDVPRSPLKSQKVCVATDQKSPITSRDELSRCRERGTPSPMKCSAEEVFASRPPASTSGSLHRDSQENPASIVTETKTSSTPQSPNKSPVKSKNVKKKLDPSATFRRNIIKGKFPYKKKLAVRKVQSKESDKLVPLLPFNSQAFEEVLPEEDVSEPCQKKRRIAHSSLKIEQSPSKRLQPLIAIDEKMDEALPLKSSKTAKPESCEDRTSYLKKLTPVSTDVVATFDSDDACSSCNRTVLLCSCQIERILREMMPLPAPLSPIRSSPEPWKFPEIEQTPVLPSADPASSTVDEHASVLNEGIFASTSSSTSLQVRQAQLMTDLNLSDSSSNESDVEMETCTTITRTVDPVAGADLKMTTMEESVSQPGTSAASSMHQEVHVDSEQADQSQDSSEIDEYDLLGDKKPKIKFNEETRKDPEQKGKTTLIGSFVKNTNSDVAQNPGSLRRATRRSKISIASSPPSVPEGSGPCDKNTSSELTKNEVSPRRVTRSTIADLSTDEELGSPFKKPNRKVLKPRKSCADKKNNATGQAQKKASTSPVPCGGKLTRRRISKELSETPSNSERNLLESNCSLNHVIDDKPDEGEATGVPLVGPIVSDSSETRLGNAPDSEVKFSVKGWTNGLDQPFPFKESLVEEVQAVRRPGRLTRSDGLDSSVTRRKHMVDNGPSVIIKMESGEIRELRQSDNSDCERPMDVPETTLLGDFAEPRQRKDRLRSDESSNQESGKVSFVRPTKSTSPERCPANGDQSMQTSSLDKPPPSLKPWNSFKELVVEEEKSIRRSKRLSSGSNSSDARTSTTKCKQEAHSVSYTELKLKSSPTEGKTTIIPEEASRNEDTLLTDGSSDSNSIGDESSKVQERDPAQFHGNGPERLGFGKVAKLNEPSTAAIKTVLGSRNDTNSIPRRSLGSSARDQLCHLGRFFSKTTPTNPVHETTESDMISTDAPTIPRVPPTPTALVREETYGESEEDSDQEMVIDFGIEATFEKTSGLPTHVETRSPPSLTCSQSALHPGITGFYKSIDPAPCSQSAPSEQMSDSPVHPEMPGFYKSIDPPPCSQSAPFERVSDSPAHPDIPGLYKTIDPTPQSIPPERMNHSPVQPEIVGFYKPVDSLPDPKETETSKPRICHLVEAIKREVPAEEVVACSINIIPFSTYYPLPEEKLKTKIPKLNEKCEEKIKNGVNEYFVTQYSSASRDKAKAFLSKCPASHVARAICQVVADSKPKMPQRPKSPCDFLTPTQSKALVLVTVLADGNLKYFQNVLTVLENNLIESPMKGADVRSANSYVNLATMYALLCRCHGFLLRAQSFIYDVLYSRQLTIFIIVHRIISLCPTVFPRASFKMGPLAFTLGYLIMKQGIYQSLPDKILSTYCVTTCRNTLERRFGYQFPADITKDAVVEELFSKIMYQGSDKAIVLLCKSQGYKWTHSVAQKYLFPIIDKWIDGVERDEARIIRHINILGEISRGFAEAICPVFVGRSLNVLGTILQLEPGLLIAEAVTEALCHFQRLDCDGVAKILSSWIPHDYKVSHACVRHVKRIISMKSPSYWSRFVS